MFIPCLRTKSFVSNELRIQKLSHAAKWVLRSVAYLGDMQSSHNSDNFNLKGKH